MISQENDGRQRTCNVLNLFSAAEPTLFLVRFKHLGCIRVI